MKITMSPFTDGQLFSFASDSEETHAVLADESNHKSWAVIGWEEKKREDFICQTNKT